MKVRSDFVTNSSSSSFVIMYKSIPEVDRQTLEKYPFINNYVKMLEKAFLGNGETVTSIKELEDYFVGRYGWSQCNTIEKLLKEEDYVADKYNIYKEKVENNYNIAFKEVDYNDESASEMLNSLHDGINFIVEGEN